MGRVKITSRAGFYSGDWRSGFNCDIVEQSGNTVICEINLLYLPEIISQMNCNHVHQEGIFYYSQSHPHDDEVDYYIKYRNPIAP